MEQTIRVAIAAFATPGVDVRRNQAPHLAVSFLGTGAAEAIVGEVCPELGRVGVVSAAGMRGVTNRRAHELRLYPVSLGLVAGALEEERFIQIARQLAYGGCRNRDADLVRRLGGDLLDGQRAGKPR
jgi:hypothetical protein